MCKCCIEPGFYKTTTNCQVRAAYTSLLFYKHHIFKIECSYNRQISGEQPAMVNQQAVFQLFIINSTPCHLHK